MMRLPCLLLALVGSPVSRQSCDVMRQYEIFCDANRKICGNLFGECHSSLIQQGDTHNGERAALAIVNPGTLFRMILLSYVCDLSVMK